MQKVGRVGMAVLVMAMLLASVSGLASAQGATKQVGVVVLFDDGTEHLEIVSVPAAGTALDVLEAMSLDVATFDGGGGFIALCSIDGQGCPAGDCFCSDTEYWGFFTLNAAGDDWDVPQVGIAQQTPADMSVIGFAWTGFDANFNPTTEPPVYTFQQIEDQFQPTPTPQPTPQPQEIPEPATLVLIGSGLAGLAGYMGLRRRAR
jgi:hypothetical protein